LPFLIYLNFAIVLPIGLFQNGVWRLALLAIFAAWIGARARCGAMKAMEQRLADAGAFAQLALFGAVPLAVFAISLASPNKVRIWEALVVAFMVAAAVWRNHRSGPLSGKTSRLVGAAVILLALSVPALNLLSGILVPKLSDVATRRWMPC